MPQTGGMPQSGAGGMPASTGGAAAPATPSAANPSAGTGASGTTPVNLDIPGEKKPVPMLMGQPDANGTKQLYSTDGQHRGSIDKDGKLTFDNKEAANKVVNWQSDGHAGYDMSNNGSGGYTLNAGQLTDGNLPSSS